MPVKNDSHVENHLHTLILPVQRTYWGHDRELNSICKDFIESGNHLPVHYPNYLSYVNT